MNLRIINNKVFKNATWIVGVKIVQSILSFIVGMLTARYLGPSNYGIIQYAASLTAFVVPLMNLGFSNILVQEIISNKDNEGEIIGTAIVFSVISSLMCIIGIILASYVLNPTEKQTVIICGLYSIQLIFQALELIRFWFQANYLSKFSSVIGLIAYVFVSGYKIFLLATKKSIYWFSLSNTLDCFIIAVGMMILYKKLGGSKFGFSFSTAKRMFDKSKHYIFSSLMVTVFAQTDKIMLKMLLDESATGFYSASITCCTITGFVFVAIIDSFRPKIFECKKNSEMQFEKNISRLYCVIFYLSLAQCIGITVLAEIIIKVIYGQEYIPSITPLRICVWYTTYSYFGSVRNIWILAENKQKYLWIINLSGALVNVVLNTIMIPFWGISGAALASLATQIFTNVILNMLIKPIKKVNVLMVRGLNPNLILELLK